MNNSVMFLQLVLKLENIFLYQSASKYDILNLVDKLHLCCSLLL